MTSPFRSQDVTPLPALLAAFPRESVLRVRRGHRCWEGGNRATGEPGLRPFRTASVTKTLTAATVLRLAEQRVVGLEDPLDAFLPSSLCDRLHVLDGVSRGRAITLRQLLDHSSGLRDYVPSAGFMARVLREPAKRWTAIDLIEAALEAGPPDFRPGAAVAYSDTGYVLLALVIEAATRQPLAEAYRCWLLDPVGLPGTYLEGREPARGEPPGAAYFDDVDTSAFDPSFDAWGGGGLVSTARDLDRFITCLFQGQVFSEGATLRAMLAGAPTPPGVGTRKTFTACGISEFAIAGLRLWGHLGHWSSFMLHAPASDLSICGTLNQSAPGPAFQALLEAAVIEGLGWDGPR